MKYSLLNPNNNECIKLSAESMHDLGMDAICKQIAGKESEQNLILNTMSYIYSDPYVTKYRCDVFEDIMNNKNMRDELMKILDRINFLRDYGGFNREYDESANVWDLMHRLDEINDYIECVDAIHTCLEKASINSKGLVGLKEYIEEIYSDNGFAQLKSDISKLKLDTSNLKSITIGINLNDRFEADGIGLVSVNSKYFTKSNVLSNFYDHVIQKDKINADTEWKDNYKYQAIENNDLAAATERFYKASAIGAAMNNPFNTKAGIANIVDGDATKGVTHYMDRAVNQMVSGVVKKLKETLKKYVNVTITDMTDLIPELFYYIKWAEYIEKLMAKGAVFSKPEVLFEDKYTFKAKDVYNIKLVAFKSEESDNIVTNDLEFDEDHRLYILTGANRGGKTTITQTIGQLFVLGQGGIYIPGKEFEFAPVDSIYTHFPADEDKTFDLGRLGEECKRFKDMYMKATDKSLLLMNETFSTTSFEEGYYIAKDSVKAILSKGSRCLYNTHMHKLAFDIDEINDDKLEAKAYSLIVHNEEEKRSYKIEIAPPQGKSYANDIAKKYGVTYDMLVNLK